MHMYYKLSINGLVLLAKDEGYRQDINIIYLQ